jgi:hypothetical protein
MACNTDKIEIYNHKDSSKVKQQELHYNRLADSLKSLIITAEEFCNWYVNNSNNLNNNNIVYFNNELGYYQFNNDSAKWIISEISNIGFFSNDFINIYIERIDEIKEIIVSNKIKNKHDNTVKEFIGFNEFFNNFEFTVPNKNNIKDLHVSHIEVFNELIIIYFHENIPVFFSNINNKWFVTYSG